MMMPKNNNIMNDKMMMIPDIQKNIVIDCSKFSSRTFSIIIISNILLCFLNIF